MQTRKQSLVESLTQTIVGGIVGILTQIVVFPLYGIPALPTGSHVQITLIFMLMAWVKSYVIRRLFNGWWI